MIKARLIEHIDPLSFARIIDRRSLFLHQWRFRKQTADSETTTDSEQWKRRVAVELEPMLSARIKAGVAQELWKPAAVYAVVPAWSGTDSMILGDGDPETAFPERPVAVFDFVRDEKGHCLSDGLPVPGLPGKMTGWMAVTLGQDCAKYESGLKDTGNFEEYHLFHGLCAALTDALAEEIHRRIRIEMGIAGDDSSDPEQIVRGRYRGRRFSFGYPCCPDLSAQAVLLKMLGADRIGISLNSAQQMEPEFSVTAGVISWI